MQDEERDQEQKQKEYSVDDEPPMWTEVYSALPIIAGGAAGYLFGGATGGILGAFTGDVLTGAKGARRVAVESRTLVASVKKLIRHIRE